MHMPLLITDTGSKLQDLKQKTVNESDKKGLNNCKNMELRSC